MSAEQLAAIAGVLLSLLFSYLPGLSAAFEKLDPTYKRLIMAGLLLAVAGGVLGLSCGGVLDTQNFVSCDKPGIIALVNTFIMALIANQGAYMLSPQKKRPFGG